MRLMFMSFVIFQYKVRSFFNWPQGDFFYKLKTYFNFLELPLQSPQTGCLKTTEMYSLLVLGAKSLKSRYCQGWFFVGIWRRICSNPVLAFGSSQKSLTVLGLKIQHDFILMWLLCKDSIFKESPIHRYWGLGFQCIFLRDSTQLTTLAIF